MARGAALAAAIVVSLLAVSGAGGSGAQAPKRGGTVVVGPVAEPTCLNPLLLACEGTAHFWIVDSVLARPFDVAPDFSERPKLVSEATYTTKPPFTLTYRIRAGARWSDGVPITARDFVFTHHAIVEYLPPENAGPHADVVAIRAVDSKTVRVVLRARRADWRSMFGWILPRHALVGRDLGRMWSDGIANPRTGRPIGSGPFLVERWQRGEQLTLVRNPRYWGPHPAYLDQIVIRFCRACTAPPPAEIFEGMRRNTLDLSHFRDPSIAGDLKKIPGVRVLAAPSTGWEHLELRLGPGGNPALRKKTVRQAIAYGIDRVAIVNQLFGAIDPRYPPSDSAVFLNRSRSYVPNWKRYRYRPELSRRLLEQAGCRRGADGIYVCDGTRLSLRFWTIAGTTVRQRGLELMQSQLRRAGVEIELRFAPPQTLFGQVLPGGDFDAVHFAFFVSTDTLGKSVFNCSGSQNFTGYCQRLVTKDLDQAGRILDPEQGGRVLNRADRQMAKDVPAIPLYQIPFVTAFRRELRNFVVAPFNVLWNAENWWLER